MTLPPLPDLPKPAYLRRLQRPDGGYSMVPAYTPGEMRDYARAAIAAHVPEADCGNIAAVPAQPVAWLYQTKSGFRKCWHAGEQSYPAFIADMAAASEFPETHSWTPLYAAPQAVPVPDGMALTDDPWRKLYRRAINEANGLTNYVEDRPELRGAERRLAAIEAEARTLAQNGEKLRALTCQNCSTK